MLVIYETVKETFSFAPEDDMTVAGKDAQGKVFLHEGANGNETG